MMVCFDEGGWRQSELQVVADHITEFGHLRILLFLFKKLIIIIYWIFEDKKGVRRTKRDISAENPNFSVTLIFLSWT